MYLNHLFIYLLNKINFTLFYYLLLKGVIWATFDCAVLLGWAARSKKLIVNVSIFIYLFLF